MSAPPLDPNQNGDPTKKTYHKQPTGLAAQTAAAHSADHNLKLYGSCFCPFVQRIWIALEAHGFSYQYIEVDVYRKPKLLLDINPRGLVPALRHGDWGGYESSVLMEFLEDLADEQSNVGGEESKKLLPHGAQQKAHSRLWTDHINRHILPAFYAYLQSQTPSSQASTAATLKTHLTTLISAADPTGPFFLPGDTLSFVDVQLAPWLLRFKRVLTPYRGWPAPEAGSRWEKWVNAIEGAKEVKRTTSGDEFYLESYERYAENRPNTSEVAEAIRSGKGLP